MAKGNDEPMVLRPEYIPEGYGEDTKAATPQQRTVQTPNEAQKPSVWRRLTQEVRLTKRATRRASASLGGKLLSKGFQLATQGALRAALRGGPVATGTIAAALIAARLGSGKPIQQLIDQAESALIGERLDRITARGIIASQIAADSQFLRHINARGGFNADEIDVISTRIDREFASLQGIRFMRDSDQFARHGSADIIMEGTATAAQQGVEATRDLIESIGTWIRSDENPDLRSKLEFNKTTSR